MCLEVNPSASGASQHSLGYTACCQGALAETCLKVHSQLGHAACCWQGTAELPAPSPGLALHETPGAIFMLLSNALLKLLSKHDI